MIKFQPRVVMLICVISSVASPAATVILTFHPSPVEAQKAISSNQIANGAVTTPR